ncbi:hypothetical protein TcCL_NonESM05959, partial [Trypanosoma cruzi]
MGLSPDPHRRRMPWTAAKECVPGVVRSSKEKMVLDGARRVDVDCVDRASQVYPLETLRAAVATCEYNTFGGKNIFNWSLRWNPMCSGNALRQGVAGGDARRGRHSHRHLFPSPRDHNAARANTPCGFSEAACAVLFVATVPPSPSVGADVPVDASSYRLRTHPLIDAAGTAPSSWCTGTGDENTADQVRSDGAGSPVSIPPTPAASTEIDGKGEESNDCQGNNCLLTSLPVKQPEELTTTSVTNNDEA